MEADASTAKVDGVAVEDVRRSGTFGMLGDMAGSDRSYGEDADCEEKQFFHVQAPGHGREERVFPGFDGKALGFDSAKAGIAGADQEKGLRRP